MIDTKSMRAAVQDTWPSTTHYEGCEYSHYPCAILKLCDELDASREENERLRGIIREAIADCSSGWVATIGEFKVYTPQVDMDHVGRWRDALEGGE